MIMNSQWSDTYSMSSSTRACSSQTSLHVISLYFPVPKVNSHRNIRHYLTFTQKLLPPFTSNSNNQKLNLLSLQGYDCGKYMAHSRLRYLHELA